MSDFQSRQGDVYFRSVKGLPNKKLEKKKDNILAYGEVTGHSHKITSSFADCEGYTDDNGDIYVCSPSEMIVGHDEHSDIVLPSNEWIIVTRQREYSPLDVLREARVRD